MLRFLIPLLFLSQNPAPEHKQESQEHLEQIIESEKNIYEDVVYVRGNPIKIEINDAEKYFKANTQDEDLARKALFTAKVKRDYKDFLYMIIKFGLEVENAISYLTSISLNIPRILDEKSANFYVDEMNEYLKSIEPEELLSKEIEFRKDLSNFIDIVRYGEKKIENLENLKEKLNKKYILDEVISNKKLLTEILIRIYMDEMASKISSKLLDEVEEKRFSLKMPYTEMLLSPDIKLFLPSSALKNEAIKNIFSGIENLEYRRLLAFIDPTYIYATLGEASIIALHNSELANINLDNFSLDDAVKIYKFSKIIGLVYLAENKINYLSSYKNFWYDVVESISWVNFPDEKLIYDSIKKFNKSYKIKELKEILGYIPFVILYNKNSTELDSTYSYYLSLIDAYSGVYFSSYRLNLFKRDLFILKNNEEVDEIINSYKFISGK